MDGRRTADDTELFLVFPNEIGNTERLWNCLGASAVFRCHGQVLKVPLVIICLQLLNVT